MAEKRMFSAKIIESDAFLDIPATAQMLYFHICMNADDDGFVNNPRKIIRMCGASEDDLKSLMDCLKPETDRLRLLDAIEPDACYVVSGVILKSREKDALNG